MKILLLFLVLNSSLSFAEINYLHQVELGTQEAYQIQKTNQQTQWVRIKHYAEFLGGFESDPYSAQASARSLIGQEAEIELRSLYFKFQKPVYDLTFGFQEIAWGETFGFQIADLVNPVDYRDPLLLNPSWYRIPVAAVNMRFFIDQTTLQFVLVPVARSFRLSKSDGIYSTVPDALKGLPIEDSEQFRLSNFGTNAEFGGRIKHLFENGLEGSFLYYRHFNRNPVLDLSFKPEDFTFRLSPVMREVHSFGLGFNNSFNEYVVRGDFIYNLHSVLQSETEVKSVIGNQFQSIVGIENTQEQGLILGLQHHQDLSQVASQHWVSLRIFKRDVSGKNCLIEPEAFVFKGINNQDFWIKPQINFYYSHFSLTLGADVLTAWGSKQAGSISAFEKQDRIFSNFSMKF